MIPGDLVKSKWTHWSENIPPESKRWSALVLEVEKEPEFADRVKVRISIEGKPLLVKFEDLEVINES